MSKLILPAALLAVLLCPAEVLARDYGQRGTVFPVIEHDLLEQIHSRLTQMERSGETARLNEDLKRRTILALSVAAVCLVRDRHRTATRGVRGEVPEEPTAGGSGRQPRGGQGR